jgi:pyruvate dehydrogenase E2 component (dihydrolipoamide acetyltransferase)
MPQLGETVADGTVTKWFKRVGDPVEKGETLFEVSTDKVDTEISAQASGVLSAIYVEEGETVDVGTVVADISSDIEERGPEVSSASPLDTRPDTDGDEQGERLQSPTHARLQLSPAVRRLLQERGLSPNEVIGTGPGGRITKDDVISHGSNPPPTLAETPTQSPVVRRLLAEHGIDASAVTASGGGSRLTRHDVEAFIAGRSSSDDETIPFTRIRRLTAEHVVHSKATSAHTLMVREVDYESVEGARRRYGAAFKEREGFSLTYLPFNAFATLLALRAFPFLNASVGDNELIAHHRLNLGIAVDLDNQGLVVPVIKRADSLGVVELARAISEMARKARDFTLGVDDYTEGTFTITNPGPFGTLMTGAVINQPQVAILSTDAVARRPVVITNNNGDEAIAIHSMGLLALTFDHRAVDGAYAARFLREVSNILVEHDWDAAVNESLDS